MLYQPTQRGDKHPFRRLVFKEDWIKTVVDLKLAQPVLHKRPLDNRRRRSAKRLALLDEIF